MNGDGQEMTHYFTEADVSAIEISWEGLIHAMRQTVIALKSGDFSQPIKPYLRYPPLKNRLIAMPAYVGGEINRAGMKWIASFPENHQIGLPRAHSVTILNHPRTGQPLAVFNSTLLSTIRTAAVSGLFLEEFAEWLPPSFRVGIIGFGPIGRYHLQMMATRYGERIEQFCLFDLRFADEPNWADEWVHHSRPTTICASWEEVYDRCDVLITATVAANRYIHRVPPSTGKILLHISLRDYQSEVVNRIPFVVVDSWDEVCREQTDIECWANECGGQRHSVLELADAISSERLQVLSKERPTVMFCPMGMAVFDIATADFYLRKLT